MKTIKDIRLYKSEKINDFGLPITTSFTNKKLSAVIHRIVMKLREQEFSLGDFDHLYINFTICNIPREIELSEKVDREHPWYRYCSVKINEELYFKLDSEESNKIILKSIEKVLVSCFATEEFDEKLIHNCVKEAIEYGEDMLMLFKEKSTSNRKAKIFLRYLDSFKYLPLLRVYDCNDSIIFEKDLPETITLDCFGNIQLSSKKITIKPRKNIFAVNMKDIVFEF